MRIKALIYDSGILARFARMGRKILRSLSTTVGMMSCVIWLQCLAVCAVNLGSWLQSLCSYLDYYP